VLWQRNLGADYGRFAIMWTYGSSPLLYDGKLYVQVLQRNPVPGDYPGITSAPWDRESYLLALDPATGKTLWKHVRPTDAKLESMESYASPVPHIGADGKAQLLLVGGDCLTGHDPATGAELWRGYGLNRKRGEWMRIVPSPVSAAGPRRRLRAEERAADRFSHRPQGRHHGERQAWVFDEKKTPDVCTPAFYDGKLFALDGDSATLTCLERRPAKSNGRASFPSGASFARRQLSRMGKCISSMKRARSLSAARAMASRSSRQSRWAAPKAPAPQSPSPTASFLSARRRIFLRGEVAVHLMRGRRLQCFGSM
jgi:outer membrane protein assembly factor BamB